jgi:hypothetical protein
LRIHNALRALADEKDRAAARVGDLDEKQREFRGRIRLAVNELDHELFDLDNVCAAAADAVDAADAADWTRAVDGTAGGSPNQPADQL